MRQAYRADGLPHINVQIEGQAASGLSLSNVGLDVFLAGLHELVTDAPSRVVPALAQTVKFSWRAFQPSWRFES